MRLHWLSREDRQGEMGFVFNHDYQGRGLASEAALVMLRFGFEDLDLHRIAGRRDARNLASARLMERLGMRLEAHLVKRGRQGRVDGRARLRDARAGVVGRHTPQPCQTGAAG